MANNIIRRTWKQGGLVNIEDLRGSAFQAEDGGHTFLISGLDENGDALALSGTPAGVLLRADGQDVTLTCSVSEGVVSATLPANAYVVPGRVGITIFLTSGGQKTAIYAAVGSVSTTSSGIVAPPAGSDVVDLVNAIATAVATIPASYTDLMAAVAPTYSTSALYAVGSYAWYSGKLYRCTTAITSGETWTSAHWTQANLGSDVSDLKSAVNFGINKTYTGVTSGSAQWFECPIFKGGEYIFTNNTNNTCTFQGIKADGTAVMIQQTVSSGAECKFISPDDFVQFGGWFNGSGSISISGDYSLSILPQITDDIDLLKEEASNVKNANIYTNSDYETPNHVEHWAETSAVGANRHWVYYQFIKDITYKIKITVNDIPAKGSSTWLQMNSASVINGSVVDNISPQINSIIAGDVFTYNYKPSANAFAYYLYSSAAIADDIDIDIEIIPPEIIGTPISGNYEKVAAIRKNAPINSNESGWIPYKMIAGETYNFRMLINLLGVNNTLNTGTIVALAADTLNEDDSMAVHDVFFRNMYKDTSSATNTLSGTNNWYYFSYTATHNSDYLYYVIQNCAPGSTVIVEQLRNTMKVEDNYAIVGIGKRSITGEKPYLFKRVAKFPGMYAQGIVAQGGYLYVIYEGGIYKYKDQTLMQTKTSVYASHPINASPMNNGHILLSNIENYNTENESRHIYEYDYESNTIIEDYAPTVEEMALCFSEVINEEKLLLGYKEVGSDIPVSIAWYEFDTTEQTLTSISTTEIDRLYLQGGCLIGKTLYVDMNNATLDEMANPAIAQIDLISGKVRNIITLDNFYETEGFSVVKDELTNDVVAYVLENGLAWIWKIKM